MLLYSLPRFRDIESMSQYQSAWEKDAERRGRKRDCKDKQTHRAELEVGRMEEFPTDLSTWVDLCGLGPAAAEGWVLSIQLAFSAVGLTKPN